MIGNTFDGTFTPEQQGAIAEAAARIRQDGTIMATYVSEVGYVYADGAVVMTPDDRPMVWQPPRMVPSVDAGAER